MKKIGDILRERQSKLFKFVHITALIKTTFMVLMYFLVFTFLEMISKESNALQIDIHLSFLEVLMVFLLFFLILLSITLFQSKSIRQYKKDLAQNNFVREGVVLLSSEPVAKKYACFLPNLAFWKYRLDNPQYHKMVFRGVHQPNKTDSVQYLNTIRTKRVLEKLYDSETEYVDLGIRVHRMKFSGELPLEIVYGKESSFLKEICPLEGYPYSEDQLEWIKEWNRKEKWIKTCDSEDDSMDKIIADSEEDEYQTPKIFQKNSGKIRYAFMMLTFMSVGATVLFWGMIGFFNVLVFHFDQLDIALVIYVAVYNALYLGMRMQQVLFYSIPICNDKRDRKKNQFVQTKCIFALSLRLTMFHDTLRYLLRKEWPEVHKCDVWVGANKREDFFTYIVSREKLKELKKIYEAEAFYPPIFSWDTCGIFFQSEVPLLVTYGKSSHVLQSIAPAEDYDYTPEQLAAIERFNTLYP